MGERGLTGRNGGRNRQNNGELKKKTYGFLNKQETYYEFLFFQGNGILSIFPTK